MLDNNFPLYALAFFLTLTLTAVIAKKIIIPLSRYAKQPIYAEGPSWHMKKAGTPTMGGISFLISGSLAMLAASLYLRIKGEHYFSSSLLITSLYALLNGIVGFIDDYTKLKRKENAGLSPKQKLLLQTMLAIGLIIVRKYILGEANSIYFSFGRFDLGFIYYPLSILALLGGVNCANLTDGIDGLAAGVAFAIGLVLFYISYSVSTDVAFAASVLIGASFGFLMFNIHPAKIFMGDTGSLFLGAFISACTVALGNFLLIAVIGIVYLIEGISVILQVICFKLTGKRIFKMAPIHHHLEKCGWSENKIVLSAVFLTLLISLPVFALFV
jgi:phospho-N-acetylmuramoyl-pentapeptide-transferase